MNRRRFLKIGAAAALGGAGLYLSDEGMQHPEEREGMLFADLHTHPPRTEAESLRAKLSKGTTGIAVRTRQNGELTYEDLLNIPGVHQIHPGIAQVTYQESVGYAIAAQEITTPQHILTLGSQSWINPTQDPRRAVEEVHKQRGLAILNHPYVLATGKPILRYREPTAQEESVIEELAAMVHEIEVFNAQCINIAPALIDHIDTLPMILTMHKANERAKALAQRHGKKGIATSDAHTLGQVFQSGIFIDNEEPTIERFGYILERGRFERVERYVSRGSFLRGHFL